MAESKTIAVNRKAYHDYNIFQSMEVGIMLSGTEIKSIRAGRVNIRDAYAKPDGNELWLYNAHIAGYQAGSYYNHEPNRPRKLLMHRKQISEMAAMANQKGLTLVPLKLYIKRGIAKLELGVGRGKRFHDKRETITRREIDREIGRTLKRKG